MTEWGTFNSLKRPEGRTPDGRSGKVFSVRLTDSQRQLIEQALHKEATAKGFGHWYQKNIGAFLRDAALAKAKALLEPVVPSAPSTPVVPASRKAKPAIPAKRSGTTRRPKPAR